jgi:hypothetical protein
MSRSKAGLALGALVVVVLSGWTVAFTSSSPAPDLVARRVTSLADENGSGSMTAGLRRLSDFNRDGFPDLVARDAAGTLWLYPGDGKGGLRTRRFLGTGWNSMTAIVTPGDVTEDGNADVIARDGGGDLWLYPGNGASGLGGRRLIQKWAAGDMITNGADLDGDGLPDLISRDPAGLLWLYPVKGIADIRPRHRIGIEWNGYTILGPGDFSGDGQADLLARDSTGTLWLYPGDGTGAIPGRGMHRTLISGGWNRMTALIAPGNWNSQLGNDLLARDSAGRLWLYPGDRSSGFGAPRLISSGWQGMTYLG